MTQANLLKNAKKKYRILFLHKLVKQKYELRFKLQSWLNRFRFRLEHIHTMILCCLIHIYFCSSAGVSILNTKQNSKLCVEQKQNLSRASKLNHAAFDRFWYEHNKGTGYIIN